MIEVKVNCEDEGESEDVRLPIQIVAQVVDKVLMRTVGADRALLLSEL